MTIPLDDTLLSAAFQAALQSALDRTIRGLGDDLPLRRSLLAELTRAADAAMVAALHDPEFMGLLAAEVRRGLVEGAYEGARTEGEKLGVKAAKGAHAATTIQGILPLLTEKP